MKFYIGEKVCLSNDKVSPIYKGKLNEFGEDSQQKYVPRDSIGIIQGIRTRYSGTENEYNQYYISFLNKNIKLDDCNNLYNEFDLQKTSDN